MTRFLIITYTELTCSVLVHNQHTPTKGHDTLHCMYELGTYFLHLR